MSPSINPHRLARPEKISDQAPIRAVLRKTRGVHRHVIKRFGNFGLVALLSGVVIFFDSGCLMAATAPIRIERRERAEAAFKRLAELEPGQIASFLDQRMATELALTDAQRPRVATINLNHARLLHDIANSSDSVRAKGKAMKQLNDADEARFKEILTANQFTRFLAMKEAMRDALKDVRPGK